MNFNDFVYWAFLGLLSFASLYGVNVLTRLNNSVQRLNLAVERIIVKHEYQEKEIDKIKIKLNSVDEKINFEIKKCKRCDSCINYEV